MLKMLLSQTILEINIGECKASRGTAKIPKNTKEPALLTLYYNKIRNVSSKSMWKPSCLPWSLCKSMVPTTKSAMHVPRNTNMWR